MIAPEVKKLLKEIDVKKAVGVDTNLPKLIKISADIIAEPLTQAINCCLRQGIFPDNAKLLLWFLSVKENLINMTF